MIDKSPVPVDALLDLEEDTLSDCVVSYPLYPVAMLTLP
jgi:hypothetical protein